MSSAPGDPRPLDPAPGGVSRLDSWKIIAAYLGRDQRTVRRWERELGLPVRRVPGGPGRSVYAYPHELDAWLADSRTLDAPPAPVAVPAAPSVPLAVPAAGGHKGRSSVAFRVTAAAALLVVSVSVQWALARIAQPRPLRVEASSTGVTALDSSGAVAWRYAFPVHERTILPADDSPSLARYVAGDDPAAYAATSFSVSVADQHTEGGRLLRFSPTGQMEASFAFDDALDMGGREFGPPWAITTFALDDSPGARQVAVAAHHYLWNASLVAVLDAQLRRRGTFVHNGWIEGVRWVAPHRLLLAGFSNTRDAATVMLLDVPPDGSIRGQGVETPGTAGWCGACGAVTPVKVVALPRSEVNRATGSPFNRARVQVLGERVVVRTVEVPGTGQQSTADAIYEFTPSLELVRSSLSDSYRERRAELALRRRVPASAPRREYHEWTPATGWTTKPIR